MNEEQILYAISELKLMESLASSDRWKEIFKNDISKLEEELNNIEVLQYEKNIIQ